MKLMKKLMTHGCLAAAALAVTTIGLTPNAAALPVPAGDERVDWSPWHSGSGGEFSVQPGSDRAWLLGNYAPATRNQDAGNNPGFQTFCVELFVDFQPGDIMKVSLSNNRQPDGEALPQGVAWLYNQFATGQLHDYDYANTDNSGTGGFASRTDSAAAVQNTIWWLMGDLSDPGAGNEYRNLILSRYGNFATADLANNPLINPVQVLVSSYDPSQGGWGDASTQQGYRQNFLARVPDAGSTAGLLGIALLGLIAAWSRRQPASVAGSKA